MPDHQLSEPIPIRLPVSLRQRAQNAALKEGLTLQTFILRALNDYMQRTSERRVAREKNADS